MGCLLVHPKRVNAVLIRIHEEVAERQMEHRTGDSAEAGTLRTEWRDVSLRFMTDLSMSRRRARDVVDKCSAKSTIEPTTARNSFASDLFAASIPVSSWSRIGR